MLEERNNSVVGEGCGETYFLLPLLLKEDWFYWTDMLSLIKLLWCVCVCEPDSEEVMRDC